MIQRRKAQTSDAVEVRDQRVLILPWNLGEVVKSQRKERRCGVGGHSPGSPVTEDVGMRAAGRPQGLPLSTTEVREGDP